MEETIQIVDFLRTGNFDRSGSVHFGMTRSAFVKILGATEWTFFSTRKSRFPSILKYGKIEFYFEEGEEGRLYGIIVQPNVEAVELLHLKIDYAFITPEVGYEVMKSHLDAASIEYHEKASDFEPDCQIIETSGAVQLLFAVGAIDKEPIMKVAKFIALASNRAKMKQVSFLIPEETYETLRKLAVERRKSIQDLCKEIVIEQLSTQENQ